VEAVCGVNRNQRESLCKFVDGCGKKEVEKGNGARFPSKLRVNGKRTLHQKIKGATTG
jgi:hypothetical protein